MVATDHMVSEWLRHDVSNDRKDYLKWFDAFVRSDDQCMETNLMVVTKAPDGTLSVECIVDPEGDSLTLAVTDLRALIEEYASMPPRMAAYDWRRGKKGKRRK